MAVPTLHRNEACTASLQLKLADATAAKLRLPAVVGTASRALGAGTSAKVTVRFKAGPKRKLATQRRVRLMLVVKVKDAVGNVRTVSKAVTLRR